MPIPLHVKHWNDRADRDLFFTILSVKNIGIISGAEWTVIGNDMRTLGYGFTNEGCRQHFQGLRRSIGGKKQRRADGEQDVEEADEVHAVHSVAGTGTSVLGVPPGSSVGSHAANVSSIDPTRNPITRRPGPGRGRPKKKKGDDAEDNTTPAGLSAELQAVANGLRPLFKVSVDSSSGSGSGSGGGISEAGREGLAFSPPGQKRRQSQPQEAPSRIYAHAHTYAQHQQTLVPRPAHSVSYSTVSAAAATLGGADDNDNKGRLQNKRQRLNGTALPTAYAVPAPAPAVTAPPLDTLQDGTVLAALVARSNASFSAEYVVSPQVIFLRLTV